MKKQNLHNTIRISIMDVRMQNYAPIIPMQLLQCTYTNLLVKLSLGLIDETYREVVKTKCFCG